MRTQSAGWCFKAVFRPLECLNQCLRVTPSGRQFRSRHKPAFTRPKNRWCRNGLSTINQHKTAFGQSRGRAQYFANTFHSRGLAQQTDRHIRPQPFRQTPQVRLLGL